jgi:hypothetical protein
MILTSEDYFGRQSHRVKPSDDVVSNADILIRRVNQLLVDVYEKTGIDPKVVNSGWRPANYNATVPGAAVNSKHITGQAIDLSDPDGELDDFLFKNQEYLVENFLWMEHPAATKGWTHLQSIPPRSGNRVFFP